MSLDATSTLPVRLAPRDTLSLRLGVLALGGLGGSGRVAWDIAHGLTACGHRVTRLTSVAPHWKTGPQTVATRSTPNVPREPRTARADWVEALAADVLDWVVTSELEALSVHYGVGLVEATVAARDRLPPSRSLRVYATLHGTDVELGREDAEQRTRLAASLERCDGVTAVSHWLADEAVAVLGLRTRPQVIRNAVDTALFRPRDRELRPPFTLVHASNFRPVKRPLDCIDVIVRVLHSGVPARLVMIGDGPLRASALEYAHALGVGEQVEFRPPVDRATLARQLREAHVCLVTSESESFGLVALEAMASGVPFVGTRCGGLRELLTTVSGEDLSEVLLADCGDIEGLTTRIRALLGDAARFDEIRSTCLRAAHAFDRGVQLAAYAELFAGGSRAPG